MEPYSGILRLVAFELPPFSMKVPSNSKARFEAKGADFRTLDTILKVLNISYVCEFIDGSSGTMMPNGSWTGALGTLQRNVRLINRDTIISAYGVIHNLHNESDIVVTAILPSPMREQVVDFSVGLHYSKSRIFGGVPPQDMPDIGVIIKIFDEQVWLITLVSMLLLIIISGLKVLPGSSGVVVVPANKKELYKLLSDYSAALFMEGTPRDPVTSRGRFLFAIWWLAMLVLANGFCGHSRAMMMMPREGLRVLDLDHLASLLHVLKPITIKGGFYESFFRSGSDNYRKIFDALTLADGMKGMLSSENLLQLKEGKAVTLYDAFSTIGAMGEKCKDLQIDNIYYSEPFFATDAIWPIRKGLDNSLKKKINNRIRRLCAGDLIHKWIDEETRFFDQCLAGDAEAAPETPLSFKEMKTLFFLLFGCLFASSIVFLLELLLFYRFKL